MTSTRGNWLRSLLAGLGILVTPFGTSNLWAQGYGADPFKPYNSQYTPYTYPTGPATPEAGQSAPAQSGVRGANQYQDYLNELQGAGRQGNERYGIGLPYYRSAVDPNFDPGGKRQYRPNADVDRSYEQTQELVTRKYLAYFSEKDPRKRAALLKDYNQTRGKVSRKLAARRDSLPSMFDTAPALSSESRRSAAGADSRTRSSSTADGTRESAAGSARRGDSSSIPPPPPLFSSGAGRTSSARRSPSEVLNRSRRLNDDIDAIPRAPGGTRSTTRRPPPSVTPPSED
jgi:hypothetical protein